LGGVQDKSNKRKGGEKLLKGTFWVLSILPPKKRAGFEAEKKLWQRKEKLSTAKAVTPKAGEGGKKNTKLVKKKKKRRTANGGTTGKGKKRLTE